MNGHPGGRRETGLRAEEAACRFLERDKGMTVVARNVRMRGGEIDIVAREGGVLVFVEVRCREKDDYGAPEESVGRVKRRRIVSAAKGYLATISPGEWKEARFDVIAVEGTGPSPVIRHYPGAFDARGNLI
ncbi:MAG: YraN family protein [Deltaproteobacteria bacterium]|nr:YraN family protein [Deltaproteobacteria bacterium]